jgi:hypothetical protein
MDQSTPRRRLANGRRIVINVNLDPDIHQALGKICDGNRSAAIEALVREHLKRIKSPETDAA